MCLKGFCGYFSLYTGCIFIGMSGVVLAVMIFSTALFELIINTKYLLLEMAAMAFALVFGIGKIFLLFGTMRDMCWAILMSFFIGIVGWCMLVAVVVLCCMFAFNHLYIFVFGVVIIIELYYLYIIISTWWCCRSCTQDC